MKTESKSFELTISLPIVFLFYLLVAIALYYPCLNNNSLLFGTDTVTHDYLMELFGSNEVNSNKTLPLWLPYLFGGIPFIGSFSFCPFYPTKFFYIFLKFPFAFNFQYFITSILGGFFFYLFLRAFEVSKIGSLFGGVVFLLCGHFSSLAYPGHLAKFQAIIGIPLAMGALKKGLDKNNLFFFLCAGLGFALSLLASHFQIGFYSILLSLCYLCFWAFENRKRLYFKKIVQIFIYYITAVIFGFMLSSVQVFPGMEFSAISNRSGGVDYQSAAHSSFPPIETLEFILPRFTGDSVRFEQGLGHYWGWWGERLVSDYIGMGVFYLFIFGILFCRKKVKFFFLGVFIISLFFSFGDYTPFWNLIYNYLPFFNRFRSPATMMILTSISLIFLSALGFDFFFSILNPVKEKSNSPSNEPTEIENKIHSSSILSTVTKNDENPKLIWLLITLAILFLFSAVFFNLRFLPPKSFLQTKGNLTFNDIEIRNYLFFKSLTRSLFFSSLIFACFAGFQILRRWKILSAAIIIIFFLINIADLFTNSRSFINIIPIEPFHNFLFDNNLNVYLKKYPEPRKILEKNNELTNKYIFQGITSLHGYHPVAFKKYFDLLGALGFYSRNFLLLTNCRFLITDDPTGISKNYSIIKNLDAKFLVDLGEEFKYIYFPVKFRVVKNEEESLKFLKNEFSDLNDESCIEIKNTISEKLNNYVRNGDLKDYSFKVIDYKCGESLINISVPEDSIAVICEWDAPDWKAILDDTTNLKIHRVNYFFRALEIPKGSHRIRFFYSPLSLKLGIATSLLSLCIFIFAGIFYFRVFLKRK